MSDKLAKKIKKLPKSPGVYFHKNAKGEVIYVGKASVLKNRVKSYFQKSHNLDFKTRVMVGEIADIDWLEVGSEIEALFLESAMIKRYMPKYNVLLRDDKNFIYVKISDDEFPVISYTRRPMDDKTEYFGPFTSTLAVRNAMKQLRRAFPYVTHHQLPKRACLHYHLGLCPGPEVEGITAKEYKKSLRRLKQYLSGKGGKVLAELEKEMNRASKKHHFEEAAALRDKVNHLRALEKRHLFGDKELFDLTRDQALVGLKELLNLKQVPRRIECYDISHLQGTNNVASMVVFTDGVPNRAEYRKFKMRTPGNDDFAHMREVLTRRLKNWDSWPKPDLWVIDGGKGQLGVALEVLRFNQLDVPAIGLAKRFEEIMKVADRRQDTGDRKDQQTYEEQRIEVINLPRSSHVLKLIQHLRDEAHRFAVTYHTLLRGKQQTSSLLEAISGVGPATRKKLIRQFGSLRGVKIARQDELAAVVGEKKARHIKEQLG